MKRHQKKKGCNALSIRSISHRRKVSTKDFRPIPSECDFQIYEIKGTDLLCSPKIRAALLAGEVSIEALQGAADWMRGAK